jgi:hypothetical protein
MERGEIGQLQPLVENQRGFDPAVGQEYLAAKLRQAISVLAHNSGLDAPCAA